MVVNGITVVIVDGGNMVTFVVRSLVLVNLVLVGIDSVIVVAVVVTGMVVAEIAGEAGAPVRKAKIGINILTCVLMTVVDM